jgi:hypothetical protein
MKFINTKSAALGAILMATGMSSAHASIIISEVDAAGSAAAYAADWFELTNTGTSAVNISGWKMDDNSNLFANAVALRGVTSIAAGQSIVFIEGTATGTTDATIDAAFKTTWFGANSPAGLVIGNYGGSGVGLSQTADAVNIFDSAGALVTRVDFGVSVLGNTIDNAAGLNNVLISQSSVAGVNGAFLSANGIETGSPSAVPVPAAAWLFGTGLMSFLSSARKRKTA